MKKFDIYEIVIKILGLYLVVVIIRQLRNILAFITITFEQSSNTGGFSPPTINPSTIFLVMIFGLIALIIFAWLLIFRTKQITKLITKPTDQEEALKLFAERKTIYEICLVLLGLIMIVWALPDFIFTLKDYIAHVQNNFIQFKNYDKAYLITSGIKIVLGIVAISYSVQISNLLSKKKE